MSARTVTTQAEARTVEVPGSDDHGGTHRIKVTLSWVCPRCGGPRGEVHRVVSYDGSRRMEVDGWDNPCGHIDLYSDVRAEASEADALLSARRSAYDVRVRELSRMPKAALEQLVNSRHHFVLGGPSQVRWSKDELIAEILRDEFGGAR